MVLKDYIERLKYRKEMLSLEITSGAGIETTVSEVDSREVYRFVFCHDPEKSHLPGYIKSPERALKGNVREIGGYGLSCLETLEAAESFYDILRISNKRIKTSIGDSIAKGEIINIDGVVDDSNTFKHFNLYEFENCNISGKFAIIRQII